jgi:hypothetical protein
MVRGALVFPSVARIRMEGWVVVILSMRGFWDRVTEPRDFCVVFARRSVRDEKN